MLSHWSYVAKDGRYFGTHETSEGGTVTFGESHGTILE